jgi:DNA-binding response OmpR family regulator
MNKSILILDEDPWLLDHYRRIIEKEGYTVQSASTGEDAIEMIDNSPPSALCMNLSLGASSAIALLHELQSYVDTARIPVIAFTDLLDLSTENLEPYGVRKLLYTATMRPSDILNSIKSVCYAVDSM